MKLSAIFIRKEPKLEPKECIIEHIEPFSNIKFNHFKNNLLEDHSFIEDHIHDMYHDKNGTLHAILALNEDTGDGILIDSSGSPYARYSAFVPKIKPYIEQQIDMAIEYIVGQAAYENRTEFDLAELSEEMGITIVDDHGIGAMFVERIKAKCDIEDFEMGEGLFSVTLNQEMHPTQSTGMEMK